MLEIPISGNMYTVSVKDSPTWECLKCIAITAGCLDVASMLECLDVTCMLGCALNARNVCAGFAAMELNVLVLRDEEEMCVGMERKQGSGYWVLVKLLRRDECWSVAMERKPRQ